MRDPHDPHRWRPLFDEKVALEADINGVIYGKSIDECVSRLEENYPATDSRLTRISLHLPADWAEAKRDRFTAYAKPEDHITVRDENNQSYGGTDPFEAMALAKELGSVSIANELETVPINWEDEGFIVGTTGSYWNQRISSLTYNPKKLARAKKARESRERSKPVSCRDVDRLECELRSELYKHLKLGWDRFYSRGLYGVAYHMLRLIQFFNLLFGDNAHRKHPEFRKLKNLWKSRAHQSYKAWSTYKNIGKADDYRSWAIKFANWMHDECKVRDCKLHKGNWVPRVKLFDAEQFWLKPASRKALQREKEICEMAKKAAAKTAAKKSVTKKPVAKKPAAKKPAAKKTTSKKGAAKKPASKKSVAKKQRSKPVEVEQAIAEVVDSVIVPDSNYTEDVILDEKETGEYDGIHSTDSEMAESVS